MRHGDCRRLVRHQDRPRHRSAALAGAGEALDDRGEIRAGIGEEILDPVRAKPLQQHVGGGDLVGAMLGWAVHGVGLSLLSRRGVKGAIAKSG